VDAAGRDWHHRCGPRWWLPEGAVAAGVAPVPAAEGARHIGSSARASPVDPGVAPRGFAFKDTADGPCKRQVDATVAGSPVAVPLPRWAEASPPTSFQRTAHCCVCDPARGLVRARQDDDSVILLPLAKWMPLSELRDRRPCFVSSDSAVIPSSGVTAAGRCVSNRSAPSLIQGPVAGT
jgi:hypothetical protein